MRPASSKREQAIVAWLDRDCGNHPQFFYFYNYSTETPCLCSAFPVPNAGVRAVRLGIGVINIATDTEEKERVYKRHDAGFRLKFYSRPPLKDAV